jgi:hypothetical protein
LEHDNEDQKGEVLCWRHIAGLFVLPGSQFSREFDNLTSVAPQRGREALKAIGWAIQKPRPKTPKSATPEEAAAFKKNPRTPLPRRQRSIPAKRSRSLRQTSTASV